jgi:hypothetical protein
MDVETEHELITRAALDYFEGWYDADVARMDRALHDELVKRSFVGDGEGGGKLGQPVSKSRMIELTRGGGGSDQGAASEQSIAVEVLDVYLGTASAVVRSVEYHEHLQLTRTPDGWKITNTLWESA